MKYDTTTFYNHTYENPPPTVNRNLVKHIRSNSSSETTITNKRQKKSKSSNNTKENTSMDPEDEEKRKNFLERNRIGMKIFIYTVVQQQLTKIIQLH